MSLRTLATDPTVVLAATVAAVVIAVLALALLIFPDRSPANVPDPQDSSVPPVKVGGTLNVDGDRTGTFVLDRFESEVGYDEDPGPNAVGLILGSIRLSGPDGHIAVSRDAAEGVVSVVYEGLSFFLDRGECTLERGAHNPAEGLVSADLRCDGISDIRDAGTISLSGVVALPAVVFDARGDIPVSGGDLAVGSTAVTFSEATILTDQSLLVTGRTPAPLGGGDPPALVAIEVNLESGEYFMAGVQVGDEFAAASPACPLGVDELGKLAPDTTAVRLTFDCADVHLSGGSAVPVEGELVVDVLRTAS